MLAWALCPDSKLHVTQSSVVEQRTASLTELISTRLKGCYRQQLLTLHLHVLI